MKKMGNCQSKMNRREAFSRLMQITRKRPSERASGRPNLFPWPAEFDLGDVEIRERGSSLFTLVVDTNGGEDDPKPISPVIQEAVE